MGIVYEAVHQSRSNHVALKTLPAANGAAFHRFKREFRTLADINHPNLIGLHTLEADGCHWFFTMDLIQGEDFFSFVRPSGVLDEPRLRSALAQRVTGVLALHGRNARLIWVHVSSAWTTDPQPGEERLVRPRISVGRERRYRDDTVSRRRVLDCSGVPNKQASCPPLAQPLP